MQRRTALLALGGIGALVTAWTLTLAVAKMHAGAMNALDLGIYTQVAWYSAAGQLFGFTIHPHLYLGDHVELLFALVAIPFRIFPSALTLIAAQCVAVVLASLALFRFTRRILPVPTALSFSALFLLNPFTLNALAFEFHAVLLGLPFAFLAATAYLDKRLGQFWLWSALLLLTREDLALLVAAFAVLALLERRPLRWWLWPGLAATAWFIGAGILAGFVNGEGYKFLSFLQPSGQNASDAGSGVLAAFQPANLLVGVALLLPVLGLPLLAWRWLALIVLPLLGVGLAGFGSGDLILQTHYAAFFLPGVLCGTVVGWKRFVEKPPHWISLLGQHAKPLAMLTLVAVSAYSALTFGPTVSAVRAWSEVSPADRERSQTSRALAASASERAAVVAGYSTLTDFAPRPRAYAAHYAFLGKRQFSDLPYPVPTDVELVVLDAQDFATYQLQYGEKESRKAEYASGAERFRDFLADRDLRLVDVHDTLLVFRNSGTDLLPSLVTREARSGLSGVEFSLATPNSTLNVSSGGFATVALEGQVGNPMLDNVQAQLVWQDARGRTLETRLLPLGYGLWPSTSWAADEVVTTTFTLAVPPGATQGTVQALVPKGYLALNGWRSAVPVIHEDALRMGSPVVLTLQR